jgi:hypothetical protein
MLASLGWVVAELFDGRLASAINEPDLLVRPDGEGIGLSPSLLNGGLAAVPLAYWLIVVGLTGALETQFTKVTPGLVAQGKEPGKAANCNYLHFVLLMKLATCNAYAASGSVGCAYTRQHKHAVHWARTLARAAV